MWRWCMNRVKNAKEQLPSVDLGFQKEKIAEKVPRIWGGNKLGLFKQQKECPSGWSIVNSKKVKGDESRRPSVPYSPGFPSQREKTTLAPSRVKWYTKPLAERTKSLSWGCYKFLFCHLEIMSAYNRERLSKCSRKGLLHNKVQTRPISISRYCLPL